VNIITKDVELEQGLQRQRFFALRSVAQGIIFNTNFLTQNFLFFNEIISQNRVKKFLLKMSY